jgi:pimeloyl-ACP methyl ester carboxylesterase
VLSRLEADYGVRRFVLMGLCSGAVVSFRTAVADPRIVGAVLINPQGFALDAEWNADVLSRGRARKFAAKAFSLRSWRRAFTGRSDYRLAARVVSERARAIFRRSERVAAIGNDLQTGFSGLAARGVRLLLACSAGDYAMDYLEAILGTGLRRLGPPLLQLHMLPAGDHSLTMRVSQESFFGAVREWSRGIDGPAAASAIARTPTPVAASAATMRVPAMGSGE